MTLADITSEGVRLVVICLVCRHQAERDLAEMAQRYGSETTVPDWHARLFCSQCGSRQVDIAVSEA